MALGRRFELLRELGSGAFGTVYLANMVSGGDFRKRVAIKLLNGQWDASGDAGRRLRDEARLLGLLRHRSIVAVDDLVMLDGKWAVVMEHVPGADLERVLEAAWKLKRNFPAPAAMELVAAVAGALDAAWSGAPEGGAPLHAVHRDIKPSNIRLTADGDVKVLDFGIARGNFEGREAKTEQVRYGSLGYMAPERVLGEDEGPEGDIYAVGCVAVELLRGNALGRAALLPDQQAEQVQAALHEIGERLGSSIAPALQLIREMLAYEPTSRPTAALVAERARKLARALDGHDLSEFSREMLPLVSSILGDPSKEAQGSFSEQISADRVRENTATMATLVEGSPFDRTTSSKPLDPTVALPDRRGPGQGLWIGVGIGAVGLVALALWLFLGRGPAETVQPPTPTPELSSTPTTPTPEATPAAPSPEAAPAEVASAPEAGTTSAPPEAAVSEKSTSKARTTSADRATTPEPAASSPEPAVDASASAGPTLRAIKFAAPNATAIRAKCGAVTGTGATSALLRDVPVGSCKVTATIDGAEHSATVAVSTPSGFTCALDGGALSCR